MMRRCSSAACVLLLISLTAGCSQPDTEKYRNDLISSYEKLSEVENLTFCSENLMILPEAAMGYRTENTIDILGGNWHTASYADENLQREAICYNGMYYQKLPGVSGEWKTIELSMLSEPQLPNPGEIRLDAEDIANAEQKEDNPGVIRIELTDKFLEKKKQENIAGAKKAVDDAVRNELSEEQITAQKQSMQQMETMEYQSGELYYSVDENGVLTYFSISIQTVYPSDKSDGKKTNFTESEKSQMIYRFTVDDYNNQEISSEIGGYLQ